MSTQPITLEPQDRELQARCLHLFEHVFLRAIGQSYLFCMDCRKMVSVSREPATLQELATMMQQEAAV